MRISDWSSDVCSSDLRLMANSRRTEMKQLVLAIAAGSLAFSAGTASAQSAPGGTHNIATPDEIAWSEGPTSLPAGKQGARRYRSEERRGGKKGVGMLRTRR